MAHYYYSISTQNPMMLSVTQNDLKKVPEYERDYLPEALKNTLKEWVDIIKDDSPICLDPTTGFVTIDQIRLFAYKNHFKDKERDSRKGLVEKFIEHSKEPFKKYASSVVEGLDWNDDKAFKEAMEDILVEYEARAAYDPTKFPPYGMIFRHTYIMDISRQGLVNAYYNEDKESYFSDEDYHKEHMSKVVERYNGLTEIDEPADTNWRSDGEACKFLHEPFFKLFEKSMKEINGKATYYIPATMGIGGEMLSGMEVECTDR